MRKVFLLALLGSLLAGHDAAYARSAVFGGGPFYSGGSAVMNTLRSSGFTTIVLWTIHVNANGDLVLNDQRVVSNGAYVGNAAWPAQLVTLKQAPTSVNRIEVAVGSWGVNDFGTVQTLINAQGTGSSSILYRNFQALKSATGADAVDFDDETLYNVNTTVQFGVMLADLGYRVTLCPYTNAAFWSSVRSQINGQRVGTVDRTYLQVYAGGAGNNPSSWNSSMGITVDPGVWSRHGSGCAEGDTPATVQSKMAGWKSSAGITGGFMWLYDDIQACSSQYPAAQYASAINNAVGTTTPTPTNPPAPTPTFPPGNLARSKPATGSAACASTEGPDKAVNGSVTGGNTDKFCSAAATKFLQVDLQANYNLTSFIVRHAGAGGESTTYNTRDFSIQTSTDASTWTTVVNIAGNTANVSSHSITSRTARYIRLNVTAATQGTEATTRIYELEAYGSTAATPTATARATATATATARSGATPTATARATATATATSGAGTWQPNVFYAVGAQVTYSGVSYRCLQAHTSQVGWEPPNAPALWQRL